jgi:fibronectin type 3 domain-containing protein
LATASLLIACGNASSVGPRDDATTSATSSGSTGSPGSATLTWDAVTAPNLQGYRVYYRTAAGKYPPLGQGKPVGTTTYQLIGLSSQTTYYFVVTAYDTQGDESAYSNEVSKTIP